MWRSRKRQIDDEAARLLGRERDRHATAVERLVPSDVGAILGEVALHHDRVHEIMSAHALRRRQRDAVSSPSDAPFAVVHNS